MTNIFQSNTDIHNYYTRHYAHHHIQSYRTSLANKAIRDGRPRPPRHQVGWDIVRRECACQIS